MTEDLTAELMNALGEDGFFLLVEAHAGTRLYIPGNIDRSELPAAIGADNAAKLSRLFPGGYIRVPLARTFRALRYRQSGASNADVARRLGLTESGVEQLFSRARKVDPDKVRRPRDPRQTDLFDR